jgi:hypothetical protein
VVFVADSTPQRWDLSIEYLFELQRLLPQGGPPIGVVFQANKRDTPGAIEMENIRLRLGDARWSIGVVESVAADGTGIREAFVYGVRLALDRVRELIVQQKLPQGPPELTSPAQLLRQLEEAEGDASKVIIRPRRHARVASAPDSLAAALLREVLEAEETPIAPSAAPGSPRPPDASVPSGAIWPPVEGRAILYEVSQLDLVTRSLGNGDWSAGLGSGWRIVSSRDAVFESLDVGRGALIQWARLHAACLPAVSPRRCIVLAATGDGAWRLWQIVRAEPSLRDHATGAARELTPELAIFRLCETAQLLVDLNERLATMPCELPCSLDTAGQSESSAVYIGLMPGQGSTPRVDRLDAPSLLSAELGPVLELDLAEQRQDLGRALERIPRRFMHAETVVASLASLLQ